MSLRLTLTAFAFAGLTAPAFAAEPTTCTDDPRVLCIKHNPSEVVHLSAAVGQTIRIELGRSEDIDGLFVSDQRLIGNEDDAPPTMAEQQREQMQAQKSEGGKPPSCSADPNLQRCVVMNFVYLMPRRPLQDEPFFLQSHWTDPAGKPRVEGYAFDLSTVRGSEQTASADPKGPPLPQAYYAVRLLYPERDAEEQAAQKKAAAAAWRAAHPIVQKAATPKPLQAPCDQPGVNRAYLYRGPGSIKPYRVCDDGRTTYLIYSGNSLVPAVFTYNPDGAKTNGFGYTVDPGPGGNVIRIGKTAPKWCVEYGGASGCIFNTSSDPQGAGTPTIAASQK